MSAAHVVLFEVLLALVAIHVAAALWHEFVRQDAVMRRIGVTPSTRALLRLETPPRNRDMGRDIRFLLGLVGAFAAITLVALWAGMPHHYVDELLIGISIFSVFTVAGWWAVSSLWSRIGPTKQLQARALPGRPVSATI